MKYRLIGGMFEGTVVNIENNIPVYKCINFDRSGKMTICRYTRRHYRYRDNDYYWYVYNLVEDSHILDNFDLFLENQKIPLDTV